MPPRRQTFVQLSLRCALDTLQQLDGYVMHMMPKAKLLLEPHQKARRHLCVCQRAVVPPGNGQTRVFDQRDKLVTGCERKKATGEQQGANEALLSRTLNPGELGIPESGVERRVMGDDGDVTDKVGDRPHHVPGRGRTTDHGVGDAGQGFDVSGYAYPGVHQALVTSHHPAALEDHRRDLGSPVALRRRQPCSFEIDDRHDLHDQRTP